MALRVLSGLTGLLAALASQAALLSRTPGGETMGLRSRPTLAAALLFGLLWLGFSGWRYRRAPRAGLWLRLGLLPGLLLVELWVAQALGAHGLNATYYRNPAYRGEPFHVGIEGQISLDLVRERHETFPQYNFSTRWIGWIRIPRSGSYRFITRADDGCDLFVDDRLVIQHWGRGPVDQGSLELEAGVHAFSVSFSQTGGPYEMVVYWVRPGEEREPLAGQYLYARRPDRWTLLAETLLLPLYGIVALVLLGVVGSVRILRLRREERLGEVLRRHLPPLIAFLMGGTLSLVGAELAARIYYAAKETRLDPQEQLRRSQEMELTGSQGPLLTLAGLVRPSRLPGVVYELKPGVTGIFRNQPLRVSSLGLRDGEYPPRKPPGTFRIVGLGDSIMFGWGVAEEDCFLSVLERRLNQAGGPVRFEVLNLAVPGYNTALEAAVFEHRAAPLEPDLAILNFIPNDFNLPNFMQAPRALGGLSQLFLPELLGSGWRRLRGRRSDPLLGMDLRDRFDADPDEIARDETVPSEFKELVGISGFRRAMASFGRVGSERGITLVQAAQAFPDQLPVVMEESRKAGFHLLNLAEEVQAHIQANGITDDRGFRVCPEDSHPNETIHRINALILERYLRAQELVPLPPLEP